MPRLTMTVETLEWIIDKIKANKQGISGVDTNTQLIADRAALLEAVLFNDISTNPFLVRFDNLNGVTATGVWNKTLQRIEC